MKNRVPVFIVAGALGLSGAVVVEGREPYHIEQRQHEEPPNLTYEIAYTTASVSIHPGLMSDSILDSNVFLVSPK